MTNDFIINHAPNRTIFIDEKAYLFFSGTAYLGIPQNLAFKKLLYEGIDRYGMAFGSSRNGNFQLEIYKKAEEKLAKFVGSEAALTLSSGMLAGQAVIQKMLAENSKKSYFYAPSAHPANWHLPNLELPKTTFKAWSEQIVEQIFLAKAEHSIIICNSLDALHLADYSFDWTLQLPDNQQVTLIVDDSHGLGITGKNGSGIFSEINVPANVRLVVVSSLHKAMGLPGGVIFSDKKFIEEVRASAFFAACSPITPAYLYAYTQVDEIYAKARQKLLANTQLFISEIKDLNLFYFQKDYPVFYTQQDNLYEFLLEKGIFIYSFAYPIRTGKPNTRIVLSAWHEREDILFLAEKCKEFHTNSISKSTAK